MRKKLQTGRCPVFLTPPSNCFFQPGVSKRVFGSDCQHLSAVEISCLAEQSLNKITLGTDHCKRFSLLNQSSFGCAVCWPKTVSRHIYLMLSLLRFYLLFVLVSNVFVVCAFKSTEWLVSVTSFSVRLR